MPKIMVPVPPSGVNVPFYMGYGVPGGYITSLISDPSTAPTPIDMNIISVGAFSATNYTFPRDSSSDSYLECRLYSGTKPSLPEVNAGLLAQTYNTLYNPRKLLEFKTLEVQVDTDAVNSNFIITVHSTVVEKGLVTGAASWWALCWSSGHPLYVGDVSTVGGTGEVQLLNTNIALNQDYILTQFSFRFPSILELAV